MEIEFHVLNTDLISSIKTHTHTHTQTFTQFEGFFSSFNYYQREHHFIN